MGDVAQLNRLLLRAVANEPITFGDLCATDINEGTCHAECLEGSPVVDLETGEQVEGEATTFVYWEASR